MLIYIINELLFVQVYRRNNYNIFRKMEGFRSVVRNNICRNVVGHVDEALEYYTLS